MVVTQVELTDDEIGRLEQLSRERSVPVPELIHDAVRQLLGSGGLLAADERRRRAAAASGRFRSGVTDLGRNHDKYVAEAFGS